MLAEDFKFVGPVVGPLDKTAFVKAFESFDVYEALPDLQVIQILHLLVA